jgi:hypothetical protein
MGTAAKDVPWLRQKRVHTLASWGSHVYIPLTMTECDECPECVENEARTDKTVDV